MTMSMGTGEKLDISKVIEITIGVLRRNLVPFALISAVFSGIPAMIMGFVAPAVGARNIATFDQGLSVFYGVLLSIVAAAVLQGALIFMTASELAGRKATVGEGLTTGLRSFMPLLGIGILTGLGVFCGILLLIVPGLILAVMWTVVVPCFVVERIGIRGSFSRSRDLTRNNRWRIVLLFLVSAIVGGVVGAIVGVIFGAILGFASANTLIVPITQGLGAVVSGMIGSTGIAVLYTELRRIKDGVGISDLAAVFD